MPQERETSIRRGIEVLLSLGSDEAIANGGLGVTRIGELLDREKSQISRALKALAEYGLVERNSDGVEYRLGWRIYALAQMAGAPLFLEQATPVLHHLVASLQERVHLSVLQGNDVLTLLSDSPGRAIEAVGWVGRTTPAFCTSAGQALLLDHSRNALDALYADIELRPHGPRAPRDIPDLCARLTLARERGDVALADEDFEQGLVSVAAPIRDARGAIVASLNVSAPKFRFDERIPFAIDEIRQAAQRVSRVIEHTPPPTKLAANADG